MSMFCINCGEEISPEQTYCPECGASQDPSELADSNEKLDSHDGFTSWAIGFKPGNTVRNVLVGLTYLIFSGLGVLVLIYGYLKENPDKLRTAAWISGIFFLLAGAGAFADGSGRGIIAGVISIGIGGLYLPAIRDRLPVDIPPGIGDVNTDRRNVLVSTGYWVGGAVIVGSILPETESQTANSTGTSGSSGTTGGDSSGTDQEEAYPNAFYYDESTGIVLEDGISAETDSVGSLYIRGAARNESGQDYDYVQIEWDVLDSADNKIADALDNTSGLGAGQTWRYEALAASADGVDSYQISGITAY